MKYQSQTSYTMEIRTLENQKRIIGSRLDLFFTVCYQIQIEDKNCINFKLHIRLKGHYLQPNDAFPYSLDTYFCFQVPFDGFVNYQYLINCDEMIYWGYFFPPNVFYQPVFQPVAATNTSIPESQCESAQNIHIDHEIIPTSGLILNLSAEDLIRAGYQNSKTPWTEEEDQKLKNLRDIQQLDWAQLAKLIQGRNSKMCYSRYRRLENNTKQSWKKKDDCLLVELVEKHNEDWKQISKHFPKRTLKQVKQHYLNYLRPQIKKDEWTLEEDLKLVEQINLHGKNWKVIEQNFEGRTQNQIKNRYFGRLKRLAQKKVFNKDKSSTECKNRREE